MEKPNFADLPPDELLTWIEQGQKALDQKIAAEKADINARQVRLAKLEARRAGKDLKPNPADKGAKPKIEPAVTKPRSRPAAPLALKPAAPPPRQADATAREANAPKPPTAAPKQTDALAKHADAPPKPSSSRHKLPPATPFPPPAHDEEAAAT